VIHQYEEPDSALEEKSWGFTKMVTKAQAEKFINDSSLSVHAKMLIREGPDQVLSPLL
jgi:hypothetical protein